MPRHNVGARKAVETNATPSAPPTAMPGGAAGMPDNGPMPISARNPYANDSMEKRTTSKAKEWMVTNGPRTADGKIRFNSDGYMVGIPAGKIVTAATHNLESMKAQGITIEPMPEEVEVTDDEPEAPAEGDAPVSAEA